MPGQGGRARGHVPHPNRASRDTYAWSRVRTGGQRPHRAPTVPSADLEGRPQPRSEAGECPSRDICSARSGCRWCERVEQGSRDRV